MRHEQNRISVIRRLGAGISFFGCICLLLCTGTSAYAEGIDPSSKTRATSILDFVKEECGAEEVELQAIESLVEDYCASSLDIEKMEKLLVKAHEIGCEDACLIEVASCVRTSIEKGIPAEAATQKVSKALTDVNNWCQDLGIPLSDEDFAKRVRVQLKSKSSK